jgi:hypothetical protein
MKAIQELLGHSDLRLTMRYAHLAYSSLKTTIGLLEARFPSTFGQPVGNGHHAVTRDTDPHLGADSEKGP